MILLTRNNNVIDIMQNVSIENNILTGTNRNNETISYIKADTITQTTLETIAENIDSKYKYENGQFTKIKKKCFTKKEFLDMLTQEQVNNLHSSSDANVKYFVASMSMLPNIRTDNLPTQQGLAYLLQEGYITLEQYQEVL